MAGSRLEKIGSIFTRTTGLLRSGAMKIDDKPIWYDVFVAHPPILEPRYDRPIPSARLKNIFYKEDQIRAKFHNAYRTLGAINLSTDDSAMVNSTTTQMFIKIYENLHKQGAIDEEKIFETSLELLRDKLQQPKDNNNSNTSENDDGFGNDRGQQQQNQQPETNLLKNFIEAKNDNSKIVDIKHIFKE